MYSILYLRWSLFLYACRFPTQIVFETEEQAAITIAAMRQVIPVFWTLWENLGGSKIFDVTTFSLFRSDFFLTRVKSEDQPSSRWKHLANYQTLFDEHLTLHVCWKLVLEIAKVMELGKVSRKKRSCPFGLCPNEGGGLCPNFLCTFHNCIFGQ